MIGLGEAIDIHLDATQFVNDEKIYRVAIAVAKHAEKRRAEYRAKEEPGVFPVADQRSIEKLGPLTRHYVAHSYWSDSVPWYEWMTEPQILQPCAEECGLSIYELSNVIAYQIRPINWQVFSWMGMALQGREDEEFFADSLIKHATALAATREKQRAQTSEAGVASGKVRSENVKCTPDAVVKGYQTLMATGTEKRNVAAKLATRYGVTPNHIREQRKKAQNQT